MFESISPGGRMLVICCLLTAQSGFTLESGSPAPTCGSPVISPKLTTSNESRIPALFHAPFMNLFVNQPVWFGEHPSNRIVGGEEAIAHSWPWQVAFVNRRPPQLGLFFHCGGSIISDRWILTAAHCCAPFSYGNLLVIIGDHNTTTGSEPYQMEAAMESVHIHPQYGLPFSKVNNDFCLLKTKRAMNFSDHVQPVCLPSIHTPDPPVGTTCYTTGWGSTAQNLSAPVYARALRQTDVEIYSQTLCNRAYGVVTDSMICVLTPGKSSCSGDSGGPLVCRNETTGQWTLYGVTSFVSSAGCGHSTIPAVYARASAVMDWISNVLSTY